MDSPSNPASLPDSERIAALERDVSTLTAERNAWRTEVAAGLYVLGVRWGKDSLPKETPADMLERLAINTNAECDRLHAKYQTEGRKRCKAEDLLTRAHRTLRKLGWQRRDTRAALAISREAHAESVEHLVPQIVELEREVERLRSRYQHAPSAVVTELMGKLAEAWAERDQLHAQLATHRQGYEDELARCNLALEEVALLRAKLAAWEPVVRAARVWFHDWRGRRPRVFDALACTESTEVLWLAFDRLAAEHYPEPSEDDQWYMDAQDRKATCHPAQTSAEYQNPNTNITPPIKSPQPSETAEDSHPSARTDSQPQATPEPADADESMREHGRLCGPWARTCETCLHGAVKTAWGYVACAIHPSFGAQCPEESCIDWTERSKGDE